MRNLKKEISEFMKETEIDKEEKFVNSPWELCIAISIYAHRNQRRLNGITHYVNHPYRMVEKYAKLVKNVKLKTLKENGLPIKAIYEICALHDVIEDSDITMEDLRNIFKECGFLNGFDKYVLEPLTKITHDKKESYEVYINKMLNNQEACLVKFLDMNDNLDMFDLAHLDEEDEKRAIKYIHYLKVINDKWGFIERYNNLR